MTSRFHTTMARFKLTFHLPNYSQGLQESHAVWEEVIRIAKRNECQPKLSNRRPSEKYFLNKIENNSLGKILGVNFPDFATPQSQ